MRRAARARLSIMLMNLLPGLRDVRTPLVAGYCFLGAVWILIYGDYDPNTVDLHRKLGAIFAVGGQIGPIGRAAVASVAAYLIGSAFVAFMRPPPWNWAVPVLRTLHHPITRSSAIDVVTGTTAGDASWAVNAVTPLVHDIRRERHDELSVYLDDRARRIGIDPSDARDAPISLAAKILEYESTSAVLSDRLLASKPELFAQYDRLQTEAEFRAGVLLPLVFLLVVVATQLQVHLLVRCVLIASAVFLPLLLAVLGDTSAIRARAILLDAVADGVITTPILRELKRRGSHRPRT